MRIQALGGGIEEALALQHPCNSPPPPTPRKEDLLGGVHVYLQPSHYSHSPL